MKETLVTIWIGLVTAAIILGSMSVVNFKGRLSNLDARVTTVETISIERPTTAFTIPVITRTLDDVVTWN